MGVFFARDSSVLPGRGNRPPNGCDGRAQHDIGSGSIVWSSAFP